MSPAHRSLRLIISQRQRPAFTLIELLVVISIIAVLLALLLPTMSQARAEAHAIMCGSNQKQWAMGFHMYMTDEDGALPLFAESYPSGTGSLQWHVLTAAYMDAGTDANNAEIRKCPTGLAFTGVNYGGFNHQWLVAPPHAPIVYGGFTNEPPFPPVRISKINDPSTWIMLLESLHEWMYTYPGWPPEVDTDGDNLLDTNHGFLTSPHDGSETYNAARPRVHRDTGNLAMVDGSVLRMDYKTFVNLRNGYWFDGPIPNWVPAAP